MKKPINYVLLIAKGVAAVLMLQTLYFKFQAEPESVYIFTKVGIEPWGRIGTGVIELIASVLILIPRTAWIGAGLGLGVMMGAILTHLVLLGIEVQGDGGQLFFYAIAVAVSCVAILYITRHQWIPVLLGLIGFKKSPSWLNA
ncbi:DoxX family protein [Spirosoma linguale]|uniref:DoxX family protein n=1 Tax=Spirosoma linguale (strain ATCC 33905 / DSM 74 / LMG 10896 / Claus 1) TaxID=504472 RepID=D2QGM4_SPILD|nr:hypothetical protein Slin_2514 [Spirosoma linguale DSM 74]